jgi:transposase
MDNPREERGLMIAATMKLRRNGNLWIVPSQTRSGATYTVNLNSNTPKCSCPDYDAHQAKCKHIFAVEFSIRRETTADGTTTLTKTVRVTYGQNWSSYNAAQTSEKTHVAKLLRELCGAIQQPPQRRGRPRLPLSDITFAAVMKVFTTCSGRRATSDLRECEAKGHIASTPHYNSVFNYLENPALTPILKALVEESAAPLKAVERDFAVDSSGFSSSVFERWYEEKYGRIKGGRQWVKVHLMTGVTTNVVTSAEVTGPEVADCPHFVPLIQKTAERFAISEVSADKAYLSKRNVEAIGSVGAVPYIAFKAGSVADNGCELWRKMFHCYKFNQREFLTHYHKRSNVETTFSMLKRKFGASVRSKTPIAQVNEVLCKVICHNLSVLVHSIHELGIEAIFWADSPLAQ